MRSKRVLHVGVVCLLAGFSGLLSAAEPKGTVTLQMATWKETLGMVAKHKGKIVVLDVWSTASAPCAEEVPKLVKLHQQYGDRVSCISFSVDYFGVKSKPPEYYKDKVLGFLKKQNATFENVLCTQPTDDVLTEMKLESFPAVYVFGPNGKLAKRFDEVFDPEFTHDDVAKLVNKLLAEAETQRDGLLEKVDEKGMNALNSSEQRMLRLASERLYLPR